MNSFSSGYFCVPIKSMCSQKWAMPGNSGGSFQEPAPTATAAAEIRRLRSEIKEDLQPVVEPHFAVFRRRNRG